MERIRIPSNRVGVKLCTILNNFDLILILSYNFETSKLWFTPITFGFQLFRLCVALRHSFKFQIDTLNMYFSVKRLVFISQNYIVLSMFFKKTLTLFFSFICFLKFLAKPLFLFLNFAWNSFFVPELWKKKKKKKFVFTH